MPFYETIFEDGSNSVAFYDTDEIALRALREHQRRAENGEHGRPVAPGENPSLVHRASRIRGVEVYDSHPGDRGEFEHEVTLEEFQAAVERALQRGQAASEGKGDTVKVTEAAAALLESTDPLIAPEEQERFGTVFKAKAKRRLKAADWKGATQ